MKINFTCLVRPTLITLGVGGVGFIIYALAREIQLMEEFLELARQD